MQWNPISDLDRFNFERAVHLHDGNAIEYSCLEEYYFLASYPACNDWIHSVTLRKQEMSDNQPPSNPPASHFPSHDGPRVWILSSGDSPVGISVTRQLLEHGDYVVTGVRPPNPEREDPRTAEFEAFLEEILANSENDWKDRLKPVALDIRYAYCGIDH